MAIKSFSSGKYFVGIVVGIGVIFGAVIYYLGSEGYPMSRTEGVAVNHEAQIVNEKTENEADTANLGITDVPTPLSMPAGEQKVETLSGKFVWHAENSSNVFGFEIRQTQSKNFGKVVEINMQACSPESVDFFGVYVLRAKYSPQSEQFDCQTSTRINFQGQQ